MQYLFSTSLGELLRRLLAWWRPVPVPVPVRKPQSRHGLTIVEMLVTMAISLIMMAAVVNVFARVSDSVNKRRATIEMASMLRAGRQVLQSDLAQATCPTIPWNQPNAGSGYFEIIEGPCGDSNATTLVLEPNTSIVPQAGRASDANSAPVSGLSLSGLGDYDDVLALTVRSDGEPFVGRAGGYTVESNLAEIIWYAVENPADGSLGEPGMRTLYRRVLLIAPWVPLPNLKKLLPDWDYSDLAIHPDRFRMFYRKYDISARLVGDQWVANTLADLTKRENRFAHFYVPTNTNLGFPHSMDLSMIRFSPAYAVFPPTNNIPSSPFHPFGFPFESFKEFETDQDPEPLPGNADNRKGEDIILTDVLAFDVRVYDPYASILNASATASPVAVTPGDPMWEEIWYRDRVNIWDGTLSPLGYGAYVDLGYMAHDHSKENNNGWYREQWNKTTDGFYIAPYRSSLFSSRMNPQAQLLDSIVPPSASEQNAAYSTTVNPLVRAVYDTWSFHYETDGLNQDGDMQNNVPLTDEGLDGIDNNNMYGVDDMSECETSPPYPFSLRGVQVTLRVFERDSRLPRQVSVRQSFVPQ